MTFYALDEDEPRNGTYIIPTTGGRMVFDLCLTARWRGWICQLDEPRPPPNVHSQGDMASLYPPHTGFKSCTREKERNAPSSLCYLKQAYGRLSPYLSMILFSICFVPASKQASSSFFGYPRALCLPYPLYSATMVSRTVDQFEKLKVSPSAK